MTARPCPYTSSDLRLLADRIDEVLNAIGNEDITSDDDWRWGLSVKLVDEAGYVAGYLRPHGDGWLGFYPKEVAE